MANYTPNGFSDGLFTGRVIAQNYDGSGNALRVDLSRNNALWVEDVNARYDGSGRLLTYGPSQLMDGSNNFFTSTRFNYSGTDFSKNYVQLDVFDMSANYYLDIISKKNFNVSGSYFTIDKVKIADGSGVFYTSVFNKVGDVSYNQLATYDYSANKSLLNIYEAVRSYTTTQQIFAPGKNAPVNNNGYGITQSNNNNNILTGYNSFSRYVDLRNKNVSSLSFYGTVKQSCILVVQYANPISNTHAAQQTKDPLEISDTYNLSGTGFTTSYGGSFAVLNNYDVSGWFNTQYNTKITVVGSGTNAAKDTAFGFNVPFCNSQFVRLMIYDTAGQNIGDTDFTWLRVENSLQYDPNIYVSYTYTFAEYKL